MPHLTEDDEMDIRDLLGFPLAGSTILVSGLSGMTAEIGAGLALEYNMRREYSASAIAKIRSKIAEVKAHRQTINAASSRLDIKEIYHAVSFNDMPKAIQSMWTYDATLCTQLAQYFALTSFPHPTRSSAAGGGDIPIINRC